MASYKVAIQGVCEKVGAIAALAWHRAIATAKDNMAKQVPKGGGGGAKGSVQGRPMKFPYTFSAKFAQFPFRFYMKHNPFCKYYPHAFVICLPLFAYISGLSNSPGNKKVWKEIRRKEREAHHDDH